MNATAPPGVSQRTGSDAGAPSHAAPTDAAWVHIGMDLVRSRRFEEFDAYRVAPPSVAALDLLEQRMIQHAKVVGAQVDYEALFIDFAERNREAIGRLYAETRDAMAADRAERYGMTQDRYRAILDKAASPNRVWTAAPQFTKTARPRTGRRQHTSTTRTTVAAASAASGDSSPSAPSGAKRSGSTTALAEDDAPPPGRIRHQHEWVLAGVSTAPAGSIVAFKAVAA